MEFLACIGNKIGDCLLPPIGRQLGYVIYYNSNIEILRNKVEKLRATRDGVQGLVDAAKRNGEDIRPDVQDWLTKIDEITAEVERLNDNVIVNKRCFNGWCPDWSWRYRISKEAKEKTFVIDELQKNGNFDSVSFPTPPPGIETILAEDFMVFKSTESTMKEIMEALKDDKTNMIGLYGVGGVGKTTLVKQVGKRAKKDKLFDEVVMAVVSQLPDNKKIQEQIADMLGLKFSEMSENGRAGRLSARLKKENRILIIMDDVWARLKLDEVGIPFGNDHKGCKIILTTRGQDVCNAMGSQTKKIRLNALSKEESWALFQVNAGTCVNTSNLDVVAREVAGRCGGLPIALVTVGRALGDKDLQEWEKAAQKLKESKPTNEQDVDHEVFSCLRLSYDYLKGEETKACFLLCSLFPEDHDIEIEDLARYGMGQGLFEDVDTMEEARGRAYTAIKNLKASCLLFDAMGRKKGSHVKMHDVVRHAAKTIASKDKYVLVRAGEGLKEWPNKGTFEHKPSISLMYNDICELPAGLKCLKLQTLLLQRNYIKEIPDSFLEGMTALQVLDLRETQVLSLPTSIQFLSNLRTLCLDRCKSLTDISILGELKELEILSISASNIKVFSEKMGQLTNLRLLDLTYCRQLETIPPNVISSLSRLEELYMTESFKQWEVEGTNKRSNASLAELQSLARLAILSVNIPHDVKCLPKDLLAPNLISFDINIGSIWRSPSRPIISRKLNLFAVQIPLADGINVLLERTEYLWLEDIKGLRNILLDINQEGINGLKSLVISNCNEIEYLTKATEWIPQVAFRSLEAGELGICDGPLPLGSLLKLRVLRVHSCGKMLNVIPTNLSLRLQNLEELYVFNCYALKEVFNLEGLVEAQVLLLPKLRILYSYDLPVMHIWMGPTRLLCLHNLKEVSLYECNSLRNLFSSTQARNLLQLEMLKICSCFELEVIVSNEEEDKEGEEIVFPQLNTILLQDLPSLTSFCRGNFTFEWPSLEKVTVNKCPNIETFLATSGFQNTPKLRRIAVDGQDMLYHFKGKGKAVKLDHGATSQEEIEMVDKAA